MNKTFETGEHMRSRFRPWLAGLAGAAGRRPLAPSAFHAERHLQTRGPHRRGRSEAGRTATGLALPVAFLGIAFVFVVEGLRPQTRGCFPDA